MVRRVLLKTVVVSLVFLAAPLVNSSFAVPAEQPRVTWDGYVRDLARRIHRQARHVHQQAEASAHHGTWAERQALRDLHALEQAAEHYRNQVDTWWSDSRHTLRDYERLVQAYRTAQYSFDGAHAFRHVRYDFERLGQLIQELRRYYDGVLDPYDPWNPHDPHDPHEPYDPH